ncbi:MAG: ABC transporter substrate-binding protein, partial [bacterium]
QDRINVTYVTTSEITQKTLIATAGGDPPDLAGLFDADVVSFADKNALLPLDDLLAEAGIDASRFIPAFWDACRFRGKIWAVPTTPASVALHWNKDMFRKAGLDPEKPPRTIAELDEMAERLTIRDAAGHIVQMGFLPWEPGWWNWAWPYFFGGRLWDGAEKITCAEPEAIAAFRWVQSYTKKYGVGPVQVFASGFGNFSSPQNAFMAGKVAMEIQGVWMYNFVREYAPRMRWGAAPFPTTDPALYGRSIADEDVLAIPRDARHPRESFEFMKYVLAQGPMEKLCLGQRKFTPLKAVSDAFLRAHPHPQIRLFIDLARHPLTFSLPQLTFWQEYTEELNVAFQRTYLMQATPEEALGAVARKMQKRLDRELRRVKRLGVPLS